MRRRKTEMEIEKEREKGTKKRKIMHKIQYRTVTNEHFNSNLITVVVFFSHSLFSHSFHRSIVMAVD